MGLLNSPIVKDLENGKLPVFEVNVTFTKDTLLDIFAGLFFVAVCIVLATKIIKKVG